MNRSLRTLLVGALASLLCALSAAPATAAFGLKDLEVAFLNQDGSPATLAGSHPFEMRTKLNVNAEVVPDGTVDPETHAVVDAEVPEGTLKDVHVFQAPGLAGSQLAVPTCSEADFTTRVEGRSSCPDESAVGIAAVKAEFTAFPVGTELFQHVPIYKLDPQPGVAAEFGFVVLNVPVTFTVSLNEESPYNLVAHVTNTPQSLLFYGSEVTLWGDPSSPLHDPLRGQCVGDPIVPTAEPVSLGSCEGPDSGVALLTLPRSCQGPLTSTFFAASWEDPSTFLESKAVTPAITGCEDLTLSADVTASPSSQAAESPSGLDFGLDVSDPGVTDPSLRAQSDIRNVKVVLPEGMTVNPSSAEGVSACSLTQYQAESLGSQPEDGCPDASKLGTVEVESPLIDQPLDGDLYLAAQDDNPFHSLLALYIVIENERYGIFVKQAGLVEADPRTGRLTSTFADLPQLPFGHLKVHFREGPRAPLVTPRGCGTYETQTELTPWAGGPAVPSTSTFAVGSGPGGTPCASGAPGFSPVLSAGTLESRAGSYSPFTLRLTRDDADQEITKLGLTMPKGVLAKIAGVPTCPDAAIAAARGKSGRDELQSPSCPSASRIGRVVAGAGVGSVLTYVSGQAYLAGPVGGAPLSVVVVTPAVAGPFDLGTVVVRQALTLDPDTGEARLDPEASDPIPRLVKGIPLKLRDLRVDIDRPDFTLNATGCEPSSTKATVFGDFLDAFDPADDSRVSVSAYYQASRCGELPFKPKLQLRLKGGTHRSDFPAVHSLLRPRAGDSNVGRAVVTMPPSVQIENAHINNPCTRVQFAAGACPKGSILGKAKAFSPLLDEPLSGPVYFRSNGGERELPDIVADLHGQFHIVLVGFIDSKKGRIRTTFAKVPDAPVSKFSLDLFGGKRGLLVNNRNLCTKKQRAKFSLVGQNGRRSETTSVLKVGCKGEKKKSVKKARR